MYIDNIFALYANEVVVICRIGIVSSRLTKSFDDIDDTEPSKSDKGSVDRVEGETQVALFQLPVNHLCCWMIISGSYFSVDGKSLGCQPETMAAALILELDEDSFWDRTFLHLITI